MGLEDLPVLGKFKLYWIGKDSGNDISMNEINDTTYREIAEISWDWGESKMYYVYGRLEDEFTKGKDYILMRDSVYGTTHCMSTDDSSDGWRVREVLSIRSYRTLTYSDEAKKKTRKGGNKR